MTTAVDAPCAESAAELARRRFDDLFTAHYRTVAAYARRRSRPGDADDVVAETFLVAWRRLDDIPAHAAPWLLAVARRVLANQRRAERRRSALADRLSDAFSDPSPAQTKPILRGLAALSEHDRELLLLLAWDGLSLAEAAQVLGCSRGAAKVRAHRARRRLRRALDEQEQAPAARPAPTLRPGELP